MKNIAVIQAGGTITSAVTKKGKEPRLSLETIINEHFNKNQRNFLKRRINVKRIFRPFGMYGLDSSLLELRHVQEIANIIGNNYGDFDGFLITQGTDTLSYSASLLSFMIQGGDKPVIITASQRAPHELLSDAPKNLYDAFMAVESGSPGVYVVFNGKVIQGARISKISSSSLDAFASVNSPALPLSRYLQRGFENNGESFGKPPILEPKLNPNVDMIRLTLTTTSRDIDYYFSTKRLDGLVVLPFGLGGARPEIYERIGHWIKKGKTVVLRTQCQDGLTDPTEYSVGWPAIEGGAISAVDMSVEAAYAKLMWALRGKHSPQKVKEIMYSNLVGEIDPQKVSSYLQHEKSRISEAKNS